MSTIDPTLVTFPALLRAFMNWHRHMLSVIRLSISNKQNGCCGFLYLLFDCSGLLDRSDCTYIPRSDWKLVNLFVHPKTKQGKE